jgi:hypothetical protein
MEGPPSCALIGAPAVLVAVDPLSRSAILKGGHAGAREPTFTVSTVPPQTLANRSDREGAEARGTAHCAADHRLLL